MFVFGVLIIYFHLLGINVAYKNLALHKDAWQTSTFDGTTAARKAVDGVRTQSYASRTCAIASGAKSNVWRVDLTTILSLHHIDIYYREENNWNFYKGRFAGFFLYVSNTTNKEDGYLCFHNTQPPTDHMTIECVVHGKYVIFYNERKDDVTYPDYYFAKVFNELCEVEVYGCQSPGFYGINCNISCPTNCQNHYCDIVNGSCLSCVNGYQGIICDTPCTDNSYGPQCSLKCGNCYDGASCNHVTGICSNGCAAGWKGDKCDLECDNGWFGVNCSEKCSDNCLTGGDLLCNRESGECTHGCNSGWQGPKCDRACNPFFYGINCTEKCGPCLNDGICNHVNGWCAEGCQAGWQDHDCKTVCEPGTFGLGCKQICNTNCISNTSRVCDYVTGKCDSGCIPGWKGDQCDKKCDGKMFGEACRKTCGWCLGFTQCHHIDGTCASGCDRGYHGATCTKPCEHTYYGENCLLNCSSDCNNRTCDAVTGACISQSKKQQNYAAVIAGGAIGGIIGICALVIVCVFVFRRSKTKTENPYENPLHYEVKGKDTTYTTMSTNPTFDIYEEVPESPSAEKKQFSEKKT